VARHRTTEQVPGTLTLDTADRLCGGPSHDLDVAVVEVDGQGGVGDGHGDGPVLMQAAEGDSLTGDHDDWRTRVAHQSTEDNANRPYADRPL